MKINDKNKQLKLFNNKNGKLIELQEKNLKDDKISSIYDT